MNRTTQTTCSAAACALIFAYAATLGAQQISQSDPYQGTSNPPPDDQIVVPANNTAKPIAKPAAGHPAVQAEVQQPQADPQPAVPAAETSPQPVASKAKADNDDGIVQVAPQAPAHSEPKLSTREAADPDGDIVHPRQLAPGVLAEGTMLRARLLERLSTASSEKGESFRCRVASDVLRNNQVLIPAGAEIDGLVVEVSEGHMAGHGVLRLKPETLILPDGTRYQIHAMASATPGSNAHVEGEGAIVPDSRAKRNEIEYGGAVGAGVTTGAIVAGPVGALTGGLIGAGVVTAHLLVSHPQTVLENGTVIEFTLSEPLRMDPAVQNAN